MHEMNSKAEQIIEERKSLVKNVEDRENISLKNIINLTLSVFKVSNEAAIDNMDTDFLVHQICLTFNKERKTINCSVSFDKIGENKKIEFHEKSDLFFKIEDRIELIMKLLNKVKTTEKVFISVCSYFENLDGYYAQGHIDLNKITLNISIND